MIRKLLVFAFAVSLYGQTKLTSGVPVQFLINTIYAIVLNAANGFVISIPSDPIQLEVKVEIAPSTSAVRIFVRCGQDIGGVSANNPLYDNVGGTSNGIGTVVLNRPAGGAEENCYIAMEPTQGGLGIGGRLTATIKPLPSGAPVTVSSPASIYLAGQPAGTKLGDLSVPSNSPPQVPISLTAGQGLNILAAGLITAPNQLGGIPPGGANLVPFGTPSPGPTAAAFGLSSINTRYVSLLGVFVGDTIDSTATPLGLTFGGDITAVPTLYSVLQQVFYAGNGVSSSGQPRVFVAPTGATRLFLASVAGGFNASGSFEVCVSPAAIPGVAAPTNPITISAMADLLLAGQPNGTGFGSKIASAFTPYSLPPQVPISPTAGQNLHILAENGGFAGETSSGKAAFGISGLPPAIGLDGVFVGDTIDATHTPAGLGPLGTEQTVQPLLQQSFYIGNGLTTKGAVKDFTIPAGATRLLLAYATGGVGSSGFVTASVTPDNPNAPVINAGGIVNNAGFPTGPVAPGSMVAIFGSNFGPQTFPSSVPLPTSLGGTQVFFNLNYAQNGRRRGLMT